jgi:hypothetical protein
MVFRSIGVSSIETGKETSVFDTICRTTSYRNVTFCDKTRLAITKEDFLIYKAELGRDGNETPSFAMIHYACRPIMKWASSELAELEVQYLS